jgi:hypothetical protein
MLRCIKVRVGVFNFMAGSSSSPANVNPGKGMKESKDIHKPQDHGNHHDAVQD